MTRVRVEANLAMLLIVAGYILLVAFIRNEGMRVFGAMTEVRLASEVHRALVPVFSRQIGDYEIYGSSVPAGQVGGDLVDLIETQPHWTAYVADVSGHGVPAGMTMAMFKSAAHMVSPDGKPLANVLGELNRVFSSLSAPNVFVTFACIAGGDEGAELTYALAGHLPILHYSKSEGRVEERSVSNLPLAVVPHAEFATASLTCRPGDILAILTDGLTEAADDQGRELGLEPLKAAVLRHAGSPLAEIADRLRATALERGRQGDDQTVLLVRRLAAAEASRSTA
jgi:sigma-B regulation protein RsbU (phosphoserine phosphatase)